MANIYSFHWHCLHKFYTLFFLETWFSELLSNFTNAIYCICIDFLVHFSSSVCFLLYILLSASSYFGTNFQLKCSGERSCLEISLTYFYGMIGKNYYIFLKRWIKGLRTLWNVQKMDIFVEIVNIEPLL